MKGDDVETNNSNALIAEAHRVAGLGVQIDDGHTYQVPARDLVQYAETIRALIRELEREPVFVDDAMVERAVHVMLHEGLDGRTWPEYARAVLTVALDTSEQQEAPGPGPWTAEDHAKYARIRAAVRGEEL